MNIGLQSLPIRIDISVTLTTLMWISFIFPNFPPNLNYHFQVFFNFFQSKSCWPNSFFKQRTNFLRPCMFLQKNEIGKMISTVFKDKFIICNCENNCNTFSDMTFSFFQTFVTIFRFSDNLIIKDLLILIKKKLNKK